VKSLAGQQAKFHVKLHDIKRRFLRELTDEFVQEISDFEDVATYLEDLKKQLVDKQAHEHEHYLENEAVRISVENATVEIPAVMIEHEADHMVEDFGRQLQYQQIPFDAYLEFTGTTKEELRNQYLEAAQQTVRTQLVLEAIAEVEHLQVTEEELEGELQRLAVSANITIDRAKEIMTLRDPGLSGMQADLRWRKTVEFLVSHSKVG
jgi:trigger factor